MIPRRPAEVERDACGIGFVADVRARSSRSVVASGLEALCRVKHRGALASDELTGDGAGVLIPLPHRLLQVGERSGVAMVMIDPERAAACRLVIEAACAAEGIDLVRWRQVPTDERALGAAALRSLPQLLQAIVERPVGIGADEGERRAYRARRRIEQAARAESLRVYVSSFSFRTVTYKALCAADRLADFYPDLADESCEGWFTIFHQRFATNTAPTWERCQPFRFLAHNGEINTIRGNLGWMKAREGGLGATELAPEHLLWPAVDENGSDSGMLDEALELLTRGGRSISHSAAMLLPSPWEDLPGLDSGVADFFHYHAGLIEPWDGPAGIVFSDGERVGAALDRNGLRPLRVSVCDDGLVACASEAGAVDTRGHGRVERRKLGPGQSLLLDPSEGGLLWDSDIKTRLARRRPYGEWLAAQMKECSIGTPVDAPGSPVTARQVAVGVTKEEMTVVLRPMATEGQEPTSSMGDDTPQPPLARFARPVFSYLKQRFAQVTNPPIDHLRERHVMSISTRLGPRDPLLHERPEAAALREYPSFLLFPDAVEDLLLDAGRRLDATFDPDEGDGMREALARLGTAAATAAASGIRHLVVSDRSAGEDRVAIPSVLALGAAHQRLVREGVRLKTSLVVESDEPREAHHAACLLTAGADAICPRLALDSIAELAKGGRLGGGVEAHEAQRRFFKAIEDGLLKIMSKMGISTLDSYRGAQIIEAVGLGPDVVEECFPGMSSVLGGLSLSDLAADAVARHRAAYRTKPVLLNTGVIKFRSGGEYHAINPDVVDAVHLSVGLKEVADVAEMDAAHALRRAVAGDDGSYARFAELVNERPASEPRDLLDLVPSRHPVPLHEVEPATEITRRFSTGAMSHGALSAEAHETLSVALNMVGGMANTGEGGEAPERFADGRNSGIKQVASGRFGVTPAYLANAKELQIKMAQGSKPGEGGQLPGKKVTVEIARLRHTVPGVALISPPPHHDIYSIEDLAQLIYDLKQANPTAAVSVKLVASEGVGTIAAGVVKGLADVVHVAGGDGGTGASPLSSIKNAGLPWEIGLADVQQTLVENELRSRTRIRVDGGLKTGRDVVVAALLGAEEFSFGTMALVAEGCILVRTCHRDTCPVGIASQNPVLRAKFAGTPEMVARYLTLVAEEVRLLLASLGLRSIGEAVGRTDLLARREVHDARAALLDLSPLLFDPGGRPASFQAASPIQRPRSALGDRLHEDALEMLRNGENGSLEYGITTADRAVGARLGCAVALAPETLPGRVVASFEGEAGQSFGAFLDGPVELRLRGEANDYVCKGMGGGRVMIQAPANDAGDPFLAGNTILYGATGGQLFIAGRAGERFAVRNSGAVAVVEGVGDHACEYMTAGAVVILGSTGRNLGAGMSGGEAYVYDPEDELIENLNPQLVAAYQPTAGQLESLRRVIERHASATGSAIGVTIVEEWDALSSFFKRVAPVAEVARLEALFEGTVTSAA
jgi:glutamate synthase domain-containing protein 2/glutamate synthase domain-containing protein 1/glutamate synthase domain-containing protein 3